jgi:tRNA A37 threonylcarbamoyladenosine synthetase subunit TsaC/SUA5/YrdC
VRVRITGSAPGAESWTTVGSSGDLLHAAWLALVDCLEYAIVTRAGLDPTSGDMLPEGAPALAEVAAALKPELDGADRAVLARVAEKRTLDVESADDRALAAHATALGATLFYSFGNFCAVAAHPRWEAVRRVNLLKGRPENQVGSVTTTADRFATLFDWTALPDGLTRERVLALMHEFYALGPMGFRGPAAPGIPGHLTSLDAEVRTTQLIHPGFRCPSNELIGAVIDRIDEEFLFITSANVSKGVTGKLEPAHYDLGGVQADFGAAEGIVLIGHRDEPAVRASYPLYLPMSTSILAFHKLGEEDGEPALVLERHGSLDIPEVRAAAARQGFRVVLADTARERLPSRDAALV